MPSVNVRHESTNEYVQEGTVTIDGTVYEMAGGPVFVSGGGSTITIHCTEPGENEGVKCGFGWDFGIEGAEVCEVWLGGIEPGDPDEGEEPTYDEDVTYNSSWYNYYGSNEHWYQGADSSSWYYLTPDLTFTLDSVGAIGTLTQDVYDNPASLTHITFGEGGGEEEEGDVGDEDVTYAPNYDDYNGVGDKWWLGDATEEWYFMLPGSGDVYHWDGNPGTTGDLVGNVSTSYYTSPESLTHVLPE
jgi:hypothetical protein